MKRITVILDASGSMSGALGKEAVEGFNEFLKEQREIKGEASLSLYQFATKVKEIYNDVPIMAVKDLVYGESYTPSGLTALNDAIGKAIMEAEFNDMYKKSENLFVIITDGQENASVRFDTKSVKGMIEEKKKDGWHFLFLAAGLDANIESQKYAINKSMSFDGTTDGIRLATSSMSEYTAAYRSGV